MSSTEEDVFIIAVADGHGGEDYMRSAVGSKFACTVAAENILHFTKTIDPNVLLENIDKSMEQLFKSIIAAWNEAVFKHIQENPIMEEELLHVSHKAAYDYLAGENLEIAYGTTLLSAVLTKEYWFGIQIGDGKCVVLNESGEFHQPIPWDERCFLNVTTSLCDIQAFKNFRFYFSKEKPAAVFLGTDGVDGCFLNDNQLYKLYETAAYSFSDMPCEEAIKELDEYLPKLSAKGSGDDISIAAFYDEDLIKKMDFYKKIKEKIE